MLYPGTKNERKLFSLFSRRIHFRNWLFFVAPPEEQEGQSEEEQLKQKTKERARKEFLGAVASEGKQCSHCAGVDMKC